MKLKNDLENVHNWLRCNKLTLNDTKTEYMIIGSRHRLTKFENISEVSLAIGDNDIKRVTSKKSLGFIIDDQLKWGMHIDAQCKKNLKKYCIIKKSKVLCSFTHSDQNVQHSSTSTYDILLNSME